MKKFAITILIAFAAVSSAFAQADSAAQNAVQNQIEAGIGPTWINNQPYYAVRVRPDIGLGPIGVGLDLNLEFDAHGNLRTENFNEVSDYVAVIRYLRYGTENDPLFVKLGSLDYATLGVGNIINMYNNSPSIDTRKTGMQLNLNFDKFGIQTLWSNFALPGVVGARGYVRPLQFTDAADIPIISNVEVGATFAGDFNRYANCRLVSSAGKYVISNESSLGIFGFDIVFPILRTGITGLELYTTYTKIVNYGSGEAVGAAFRFDFSSLLSARAKLERRFNGDKYLPGYFNPMYELERINTVTGTTKTMQLAGGYENGYYGDLLVRVLNYFDIIGSFQRLDNVPGSGIFHAATNIAPSGTPVVVRAGYDKVEIEDFTDLVTTDDRSYLYAELGYKPVEYVLVSMRYSWTFSPVRDNGNVVGFEPQRKLEPRVAFLFNF